MKDIFLEWGDRFQPWIVTHGVKIVLIGIGAYVLNLIAQKFIEKSVRLAVVSDKYLSRQAEEKRENTLIRIFGWTCSIVISLVAALMILQEFEVSIAPMLASAGILGLAVGFGGQYLIRDIITGFFIILENQYRIGDVVSIDGTAGMVEDIILRKTILRDLNGTVYHIPHGEIKKVANLSKDYSRVNLNIGISYSTNLEHAIRVINQTGNELAEDPEWKEHILKPPQFMRVDDFADSALIIKILGETIPLKQWDVTGELRKRIKIAFDREGIEIPFPQRVVHQGKQTIS